LTAEALGCTGRKDLCARFRAVNPATHFDLERSHKWLQGRAYPRAVSIYDDWAKVLGTARPGAWLAACTVDAFLREICTLYDADPIALMRRIENSEYGRSATAPRNHSADNYLCGNYACYSMARSLYYRGHLIRGALVIEPAQRGGGLSVSYTETLREKRHTYVGTIISSGRSLHFLLQANEGIPPLFVSLVRPGLPCSVLCGIMSGGTTIAPEVQLSTTRMAVVRVPGWPESSNRFLLPTEGAIAGDLRAAGLTLQDPSEADALLRNFLLTASDAVDQITEADQVRIAKALDKSHLAF
jgi:hypothetical protein